MIKYDEKHLPGSPYEFFVNGDYDPSLVKASGPGLEGGHTHEEQTFSLDFNNCGAEILAPNFEIVGDLDGKVVCSEMKNRIVQVKYIPVQPREYKIGIKIGDIHISGSPFSVPIKEKIPVLKVKYFGRGLENGLRAGEFARFVVDGSEFGPGDLEVSFIDATKEEKQAEIRRRGETPIYDVNYLPEIEGFLSISRFLLIYLEI